MRAAIIEKPGEIPKVKDFPEPSAKAGQAAVDVIAAGLNPVDRMIAAGQYGTVQVPSVPGAEGVGRMPDGRRVYFGGSIKPYGSMAERTLVDQGSVHPLPEGLDDGMALVLGIAGLAGWLPLSAQARVTASDNVLVLGATGVVGQVAVQAAKLLGARRVVAAGRDRAGLEVMLGRGADASVLLQGDLAQALASEAAGGYDVVVDTLFGEPLQAALAATSQNARVVLVGPAAGMTASLGFAALQGRIVIGHSNNYVPAEQRFAEYDKMASYVDKGELVVGIERYALQDIAKPWVDQGRGLRNKVILVP